MTEVKDPSARATEREGHVLWQGVGGAYYTPGVLLLGVNAEGRVEPIQINAAGQIAIAPGPDQSYLEEILIELRKMNIQLAEITGDDIGEPDIER